MGTASRRLRAARKQRLLTSQALNDLRYGVLHITDVLKDPPPALSRVRIGYLLRTCPHYGEAGVKKTLIAARVWPEDRLGALPPEALSRIRDHLPERVRKRY